MGFDFAIPWIFDSDLSLGFSSSLAMERPHSCDFGDTNDQLLLVYFLLCPLWKENSEKNLSVLTYSRQMIASKSFLKTTEYHSYSPLCKSSSTLTSCSAFSAGTTSLIYSFSKPQLISFFWTTTLASIPSSSSSFYSGTKTNSFSAALVIGGGGRDGGGGFAFWLSSLKKFQFIKYTPFFPHLLSLTSIGSPNQRSRVHTWQMFFSLLQE